MIMAVELRRREKRCDISEPHTPLVPYRCLSDASMEIYVAVEGTTSRVALLRAPSDRENNKRAHMF